MLEKWYDTVLSLAPSPLPTNCAGHNDVHKSCFLCLALCNLYLFSGFHFYERAYRTCIVASVACRRWVVHKAPNTYHLPHCRTAFPLRRATLLPLKTCVIRTLSGRYQDEDGRCPNGPEYSGRARKFESTSRCRSKDTIFLPKSLCAVPSYPNLRMKKIYICTPHGWYALSSAEMR